MSCGRPHAQDCAEVLARVYEYIDGEMSYGAQSEIRQHLVECEPCLREFGIEDEVKKLVRRSCCEPAPEQLRVKVLHRIRQVRVELEVREL